MGNACSDSYNAKLKPPVYQIDIEEFRRIYKCFKFPKSLSFTHCSKIFRVRYLPTCEARILRRVRFNNQRDLFRFILNLERIIRIDHNNLLKIYHFAIETNQLKGQTLSYILNIVFEHFDHTLQDELTLRAKDGKEFIEAEIQSFIDNITDALEFLQLNQFNHGSLRPSKIYVTPDKQYKLMFIGDISSEIINTKSDNQNPSSLNHLTYMSPQMRKQVIKTISHTESFQNRSVIINPFKSDVFSLGLITLEMMSMKSVEGLNGDYCERKRTYRIAQCDRNYSPSLCNLAENMLKENENKRPDFLDLKRAIIMEEYIGFKRAQGYKIEGSKLFKEKHRKGTIEMKTLENKSEFKVPSNYYLNISEDTEMSILNEMSEEIPENKMSKENLSNLSRDLSPTKAYTDPAKEGSNGKKDSREVSLNDLEEEKEEKDERSDEMFIENEKELHHAKFVTLTKLVINLEEKQYTNDTSILLSEVLGCQTSLNELVLALPKAKIGDEGLEVICNGLNKAREITLCFLDLRKNKITDNGLYKLTKGLPEKSRFEQCGLNFSDNRITEEGCKEIVSWFGDLENVESFALNLGGNKIGNKGVEIIAKELGKLKKLESFIIFLHLNEIEGKEGISALLNELKKMKKIKRLKIDLSGNLLGDEDMEAVLEFIKEIEDVELAIDLKDNCVTQERKKDFGFILNLKENVRIGF